MLNSETVVGVCGAGAMGAGIAQVAAQAGHRVIVLDQDEAALGRGRDGIAQGLAGQVKRGKLTEEESSAIQRRLSWTMDVGALSPCGLVIEAIVENPAVKTKLFQSLEAVTDANAVLATNTSSLSVTEIAKGLARPAHFLGLHFFNPAPVMKLVEVISGARTDPKIAAESFALMQRWGKLAASARDVPGFIVNRVARPFYSEGWRALEEGAADAATIDFLYRDLAGFRMGPLELGDVIGHDINYTAAKTIFDAYGGKTRFKPSPLQAEHLAKKQLGRKTGRGVYDYAEGAAKPAVRFAETDSPLEDDGIVFMQSDGRTAKTVSESTGKPAAVFDFATPAATAIAFAPSSDEARRAAITHSARAGKKAVELADRPGLLVFRTLLQLANAAGDAAADDVASPEAIDLALLNGVNYPFGPLQWANEHSLPRVVAALNAIADATGDAMYRPSSYFVEKAGQA
jgi:3-hydroxybutyryl-CoA dehydrogenase